MELAVNPSMAEMADRIGGIFESHAKDMLRRARRVLRTEGDAEDAVQEVMLALLRAPHVLAAVERIGAWLYTLVRRRCIDVIHEDERRGSKEAAAGAEVGLDDLLEGEDPAELVGREEVCRAIARALDGLPANLRWAFIANALEGRTFRQMSAESGVPMGTLMARKAAAAKIVREELRRRGPVD